MRSDMYVCKDGRLIGPQQVSAKAVAKLREMQMTGGMNIDDAPAQLERLRIGGYVTFDGGRAYITDAGRGVANRGHA